MTVLQFKREILLNFVKFRQKSIYLPEGRFLVISSVFRQKLNNFERNYSHFCETYRSAVCCSSQTASALMYVTAAAGYVTDLEKLDLSAVRLCFQVFLLDGNKKFSHVVMPAVSWPIIDKSQYNLSSTLWLKNRTTVTFSNHF